MTILRYIDMMKNQNTEDYINSLMIILKTRKGLLFMAIVGIWTLLKVL